MSQSVFRGDRLKAQRLSAGLTQAQLAEQVDVDRTVITVLELGRSEPSVAVLVGLAYVLRVSSDFLLDMSERANAEQDLADTTNDLMNAYYQMSEM